MTTLHRCSYSRKKQVPGDGILLCGPRLFNRAGCLGLRTLQSEKVMLASTRSAWQNPSANSFNGSISLKEIQNQIRVKGGVGYGAARGFPVRHPSAGAGHGRIVVHPLLLRGKSTTCEWLVHERILRGNSFCRSPTQA